MTPADADLVFEWLCEFTREAVPHDPPPQREKAGMSGGKRAVSILDG